ncbi:conserved protein of unknown function [Rhodovastum atsumiense]|uniref:DUF4136 domain-containing protein n=1 Tax=Rhodovastum atsumiense TaxID=504468 RepID=A0A5M6IR55_9PROT|nr:hypothetical protein [Rhodovastum atsumiense]KAA5610389.1 hypothetical protein F1189_19360 [Rhodovastum atsumiense]CAH2602933.1 conserved protein of unknown function [Rhodovastum atsumiense]
MSRKVEFAGALVLVLGSWLAQPAWALQSCTGSYSATLLRPLPRPLVVGLLVRDDSPRNRDLAERFRAGLRHAGVAVAGRPSAQLSIIATFTGAAAPAAAPTVEASPGFSWMGGGIDRQAPEKGRLGGEPRATGPVTLMLRADVRPDPAQPVAWTASLQCTRRDRDDRRLAYEIGTVIGRAIGRRAERVRF